MKKNEIRGLVILGILLVVFTVIAFALPFIKNAVFWLAYIFGILAVAVQGYALYAAFLKGDEARSKLYGFPIARIGTVYMLAQLAASLLFMALSKWAPVWVAVVLFVPALAAAAIGMISAEAVREEIEHQDVVLKKDVKTIRGIQSKARSLVGLCSDRETDALLQTFSEALQYSDPVSSAPLEAIENELTALVDDMQKAIVDGDHASVKTLSRQATAVLNERNRLCKLHK